MIFFRINRKDIRRPRRSISQREQHVLKLEIKDRLERENYSCVFKPERKPAQKEGAMQFRYKGMDNKGKVLCIREVNHTDLDKLQQLLDADMGYTPKAICFEITIARPDPEVVKIKAKMLSACNAHHAVDAKDLVDTLFNNLDIKLKGKDNA